MPLTPLPSRNSIFNEAYSALGHYISDNERIPHFNPSDSDELILPGEPVIKQWGAANAEWCFMAQGPIWPGEIGYLLRNFKAKFPCNFSTNIIQGQEVMWDIDYNVVSLAADVTNGFVIGNADFVLDPNNKNELPTVDGNGRVIVATSASTYVVVQSQPAAATVKGTVVNLGVMGRSVHRVSE